MSNQCNCEHGDAFDNVNCSVHDTTFCKPTSCDEGFFLNINGLNVEFESNVLTELGNNSKSAIDNLNSYTVNFQLMNITDLHFNWTSATHSSTEISTLECKPE